MYSDQSVSEYRIVVFLCVYIFDKINESGKTGLLPSENEIAWIYCSISFTNNEKGVVMAEFITIIGKFGRKQ